MEEKGNEKITRNNRAVIEKFFAQRCYLAAWQAEMFDCDEELAKALTEKTAVPSKYKEAVKSVAKRFLSYGYSGNKAAEIMDAWKRLTGGDDYEIHSQ